MVSNICPCSMVWCRPYIRYRPLHRYARCVAIIDYFVAMDTPRLTVLGHRIRNIVPTCIVTKTVTGHMESWTNCTLNHRNLYNLKGN